MASQSSYTRVFCDTCGKHPIASGATKCRVCHTKRKHLFGMPFCGVCGQRRVSAKQNVACDDCVNGKQKAESPAVKRPVSSVKKPASPRPVVPHRPTSPAPRAPSRRPKSPALLSRSPGQSKVPLQSRTPVGLSVGVSKTPVGRARTPVGSSRIPVGQSRTPAVPSTVPQPPVHPVTVATDKHFCRQAKPKTATTTTTTTAATTTAATTTAATTTTVPSPMGKAKSSSDIRIHTFLDTAEVPEPRKSHSFLRFGRRSKSKPLERSVSASSIASSSSSPVVRRSQTGILAVHVPRPPQPPLPPPPVSSTSLSGTVGDTAAIPTPAKPQRHGA
ncbi:MAG: hypothetical protein MHM6MM_003860 [Cercozoa sp. M6MM]